MPGSRYDRALAWSEVQTGSQVTAITELPGGLSATMLALAFESGEQAVLRLMTKPPWNAAGAELVRREAAAQRELLGSAVRAPASIAVDPEGAGAGVAAHLMTLLAGAPLDSVTPETLDQMAGTLAAIHAFVPSQRFRAYASWAGEEKWSVPAWAAHPASWGRAFQALAEPAPGFQPTFLHRDFSHRNLLWQGGVVVGVVDWVETSIGPAWLDAGHAATNLAVSFGVEQARAFLAAYARHSSEQPDLHWLLMDAVGFLPEPGGDPVFALASELEGLDAWVHELVAGCTLRS